MTTQRGAEPGRAGCVRAAPTVGVTSPSSPADTPGPTGRLPPSPRGCSTAPAGREPATKWLNISSRSNRVQTKCIPPLCPMVFAMIVALTTDTDDEQGKNRETSHMWDSPIARGLSRVSLPHKTCQAVTSGPSKPQSCVPHVSEQAGYEPQAPGLPTARENLD